MGRGGGGGGKVGERTEEEVETVLQHRRQRVSFDSTLESSSFELPQALPRFVMTSGLAGRGEGGGGRGGSSKCRKGETALGKGREAKELSMLASRDHDVPKSGRQTSCRCGLSPFKAFRDSNHKLRREYSRRKNWWAKVEHTNSRTSEALVQCTWGQVPRSFPAGGPLRNFLFLACSAEP